MSTSLASLTSGWFAHFDPSIHIRRLIQAHLARQNAKGSGNKAKRRAFKLGVVL